MDVRLVADRIHLITHARESLVSEDGDLTVVDAGLPSVQPLLVGLLAGHALAATY